MPELSLRKAQKRGLIRKPSLSFLLQLPAMGAITTNTAVTVRRGERYFFFVYLLTVIFAAGLVSFGNL